MVGERLACDAAKFAGQETSFLCGVPDEVGLLRDGLGSLQTFLKKQDEDGATGRDAVAEDTVRRIRDVVYDAENIIEAAEYRKERNSRCKGLLGAMTRYARKPSDLVALHKLGNDIIRVRRRIGEIKSTREFLDAVDAGGHVTARAQQESHHHHHHHRAPTIDGSVVGFEGDVNQISAWLTDPENLQLTVVSIVAMAGAGKTTLAHKVYSSTEVTGHFDAFAFVTISEQFESLHVLKEITAQAMGLKRKDRGFDRMGLPGQVEELEKMGEDELAEKLHNFLQGKRYLIVLDDVWSENTWKAIGKAFPDTENGSRVMLTTQKSQAEVAKQANKLTHVHEVGLLNDGESFELFCLHAFPSYEIIDGRQRLELEGVGKRLAEKCNGLPLALVVLGSHLSKHLDSAAKWSEMDGCLDWEDIGSWDNMNRIISRSYDDIPCHHLKSCFLYMASFPEDFVFEAENLTRSWIAEGFVSRMSEKTLEETARIYLEKLIQMCMVHICYWKRNAILGSSQHVQMHDVLREWAVQKARKEGFLKVCINHDDVLDGMSLGSYRLSFLRFFSHRSCTHVPNLRSMLGFNLTSVTLGRLRFLRTLYIAKSDLEKVSNVIGLLIHLRYIALIQCINVVLPSSIGQLLNLHSIDLTKTEIPCVPKSLWDIPTLRHVKIESMEAFTPTITEEQSELQTLSCIGGIGLGRRGPRMKDHGDRFCRVQRSLMNMAQLRVLELLINIFLPVEVLNCLSKHQHLYHLILVVWVDKDMFNDSILLPEKLRHLALRFNCTWNEWHSEVLLPALGRLKNLEQVALMPNYQQDSTEEDKCALFMAQIRSVWAHAHQYSRSQQRRDREIRSTEIYEAPIISMPADGFPQLKYLTLWGVQASKLIFHEGTMPKLVRLVLVSGHMMTVPDGLLDLKSLKELELDSMVNELPVETQRLIEGNRITVTIESDE